MTYIRKQEWKSLMGRYTDLATMHATWRLQLVYSWSDSNSVYNDADFVGLK